MHYDDVTIPLIQTDEDIMGNKPAPAGITFFFFSFSFSEYMRSSSPQGPFCSHIRFLFIYYFFLPPLPPPSFFFDKHRYPNWEIQRPCPIVQPAKLILRHHAISRAAKNTHQQIYAKNAFRRIRVPG